MSEFLNLEEANKRLEKLKCGRFDMKVKLSHLMTAVHCV